MVDPTIASYDSAARHWAGYFRDFTAEEEIWWLINNMHGPKVIDIGCGIGNHTQYFLDKHLDHVGIDASAGMINEAKKRHPNTNFSVMDFRYLNFPAQSFDGFIAATSLLHIPKAQLSAALVNIRQLLRPGGVGFISMKPLGDKGDVEEGIVKEERFGLRLKRYFAFYTQEEFGQFLQQAGFTLVKSYPKTAGGKTWLCFFVRQKLS